MAGRGNGAVDSADDSAAVHGTGMGGLLAVPVLHRFLAGAWTAGRRRTATGIQGVPRVRDRRGGAPYPRSTGAIDVRRQPFAMGGDRGWRARALAGAAPCAARAARHARL